MVMVTMYWNHQNYMLHRHPVQKRPRFERERSRQLEAQGQNYSFPLSLNRKAIIEHLPCLSEGPRARCTI